MTRNPALFEHPILFTDAMVRALVSGQKTQTRRVVKWTPRAKGVNLHASSVQAGEYFTDQPEHGYVLRARRGEGCWEDLTCRAFCPYGSVHHHLWVRETWYCDSPDFPTPTPHAQGNLYYRADSGPDTEGDRFLFPWRRSIHMPRWVSRLTLTITDVRVQRLQSLTEADALAEGLTVVDDGERMEPFRFRYGVGDDLTNRTAVAAYAHLWDSINGNTLGAAWDANPYIWVFAITFERQGEEATP